MLHKFVITAVFLLVAPLGFAQSKDATFKEVESLREKGYSVQTITPIFNQLLMLSLPKGFKPVFEEAKSGQYIHESVLEGETFSSWSQMITILGAQNLAGNPNVTPQKFVMGMASSFQTACPKTFGGSSLGPLNFNQHEAFAMVVSCGTIQVSANKPYAETTLIIAIKGSKDFYSIQWAQREAAFHHPLPIETSTWEARLEKLKPIKLCPRIPGESAPYPSCIAHEQTTKTSAPKILRVQAYDGKQRPAEEISTLFATDGRPRGEQTSICMVDGRSLERNGECPAVAYLIPGRHTLGWRYSWQGFASDSGILSVVTEAGRLYQLNASSRFGISPARPGFTLRKLRRLPSDMGRSLTRT